MPEKPNHKDLAALSKEIPPGKFFPKGSWVQMIRRSLKPEIVLVDDYEIRGGRVDLLGRVFGPGFKGGSRRKRFDITRYTIEEAEDPRLKTK